MVTDKSEISLILGRSSKNKFADISLEPSFALFSFANTLCNFYYQDLLMQQTCHRELNFGAKCDENLGLTFIAFANSWIYPPISCCVAIYAVLAITWSDKAGKKRKPLLLLPILGITLEALLACLYSYYVTVPVYLILTTQCILRILCGGSFVFWTSAALYLTDTTCEEKYARKLGAYSALNTFCLMASYGVSGFVLTVLGLFCSFLLCTVLSIISLILCYVLVQENEAPTKEELKFWNLIKPNDVLISLRILLRKRCCKMANIILHLMLITWIMIYILEAGESAITFLYLRQQFQWNNETYGIYMAYKYVCTCCGVYFCTNIITKFVRVEDTALGLIMAASKIGCSILCLFANQNWQMYLIPVANMLFCGAEIVTRSVMTKIIDEDEHGHLAIVLALLTVFQSIGQLLYDVIFSITIQFFANLVFIISLILAIILFSTFYVSNILRQRILHNDLL